jgi:hypothetical protein
MAEFVYPDVRQFTQVLFATEPGANEFQWAAGFVITKKNQSCDILVFRPEGVDYRSDCWHADDPRCKSNPEMYRQMGRGVFRLAPEEIDRQRLARETLPRIFREQRENNIKLQQLYAEQEKLAGEIAKLRADDVIEKRSPGRPRKEPLEIS